MYYLFIPSKISIKLDWRIELDPCSKKNHKTQRYPWACNYFHPFSVASLTLEGWYKKEEVFVEKTLNQFLAMSWFSSNIVTELTFRKVWFFYTGSNKKKGCSTEEVINNYDILDTVHWFVGKVLGKILSRIPNGVCNLLHSKGISLRQYILNQTYSYIYLDTSRP